MNAVSLIDSLLSFFDSTLSRPSAIVPTMSEHNRRTWTKQDSEDASRLLAGLVRRAKKASGGQRPEQIADAPEERTSSAGEKADGGERFGEIANSNHRPHVILGGQDDRC